MNGDIKSIVLDGLTGGGLIAKDFASKKLAGTAGAVGAILYIPTEGLSGWQLVTVLSCKMLAVAWVGQSYLKAQASIDKESAACVPQPAPETPTQPAEVAKP